MKRVILTILGIVAVITIAQLIYMATAESRRAARQEKYMAEHGAEIARDNAVNAAKAAADAAAEAAIEAEASKPGPLSLCGHTVSGEKELSEIDSVYHGTYFSRSDNKAVCAIRSNSIALWPSDTPMAATKVYSANINGRNSGIVVFTNDQIRGNMVVFLWRDYHGGQLHLQLFTPLPSSGKMNAAGKYDVYN